jgi:hypothetical protein
MVTYLLWRRRAAAFIRQIGNPRPPASHLCATAVPRLLRAMALGGGQEICLQYCCAIFGGLGPAQP